MLADLASTAVTAVSSAQDWIASTNAFTEATDKLLSQISTE